MPKFVESTVRQIIGWSEGSIWWLPVILIVLFFAWWVFRKNRKAHIHSLVRSGRIREIQRLLAKTPELIDAKTDFGATPLHCAAYEGHAEMVRLLLDRGADTKAKDINGQTPLDIAVAMEKVDVIRILTDHVRSPVSRAAAKSKIEDMEKPLSFDFFISYKSENVDLARIVADHLIASGQKVWFAEYEILLYDRDKFEMAIDSGIHDCRYGLAFLNSAYATSKHCGREIVQLLAKKARNILIVRIPDEKSPKEHFEEIPIDQAVEAYRQNDRTEFARILDTLRVKDGNSVKGNKMFAIGSILVKVNEEHILLDKSCDVNAVLGFVEDKTKRPIMKMTAGDIGSSSFWGSILGADFSLDVSGWRQTNPGSRAPIEKGQGAQFERADGKNKLLVNLYFDRDTSEEGKSRLNPPTPDDRELYDALREYAKKHMLRLNARIKGVHLLFHGGFSQLALTYQAHGYWTRKYSVTIEHPQLKKPVEFVFTFGYTGPFEGYCLNTHIMDSFVKSLKWK